MKQVVVNIQDNRYSFFLELMKSMDFVSINEEVDWFEISSEGDKKLIQKGIDDIENGKIHSHQDVMKMGKKRILELKNNK